MSGEIRPIAGLESVELRWDSGDPRSLESRKYSIIFLSCCLRKLIVIYVMFYFSQCRNVLSLTHKLVTDRSN